jgi:hypothetical protein
MRRGKIPDRQHVAGLRRVDHRREDFQKDMAILKHEIVALNRHLELVR